MSDEFRGLTDRYGARVRRMAALARTYVDATAEAEADQVRHGLRPVPAARAVSAIIRSGGLA